MSKKIKLCKNCTWYQNTYRLEDVQYQNVCLYDKKPNKSIVTGNFYINIKNAYSCRSNPFRCGKKARWFEPREG